VKHCNKKCINGNVGDSGCPSNDEIETKPCNEQPCGNIQ